MGQAEAIEPYAGMEMADVTLVPCKLLGYPRSGHPPRRSVADFSQYRALRAICATQPYLCRSRHWSILDISLERALELIAARARQTKKAAPLLRWPHPEDREPIVVMDGKYGPYVKHKRTNATLPEGVTVDLLPEKAVELITEKANEGVQRRRAGGGTKIVVPVDSRHDELRLMSCSSR